MAQKWVEYILSMQWKSMGTNVVLYYIDKNNEKHSAKWLLLYCIESHTGLEQHGWVNSIFIFG